MVSMVTREGQWKNLKFQVCDVTRPLASVAKICEAGHSVIFNPSWDPRGCYMLNHESQERTYFQPRDGVYVLDTLVVPVHYQSEPSFGRQGM